MVDTLSTFTQAMALLPDNTSRLIGPDDHRSAAISMATDRGGSFGDPGPWVVPIAASNTWTDIPLALLPDMVQSTRSLFWRMDANGHIGFDYLADWPTLVIPPGHQRNVTMESVIDFDPDGDLWQFAFSVDGTPIAPFYSVDTANQTQAITMTVLAGQTLDVSLAPRISVQCRNLSNAGDLALNVFAMITEGGALA